MGSRNGFGSEPTHLFHCFPKPHPLPYGAAAWESLGCPCKRTRAQLPCWGLAHSSLFPFCVASCVFPSRHSYGTARVKAPPFSAGISQSYRVAQPLWGGACQKMQVPLLSQWSSEWGSPRGGPGVCTCQKLKLKNHGRRLWCHPWEIRDEDVGIRPVQIWISSLVMSSSVPWRKPSLSQLRCPHFYNRH